MKKNIFIAIFLLCAVNLTAGNIRLYGKAEQYAGLNINLETVGDYITHISRTLVTIHIDDNGDFDESFEIDRITYAYFDIGAIRASIYLQPGMDYEIIMPPYIEKRDADRFNPFFVPEEIELGILTSAAGATDSEDTLNKSLRNYNAVFGDSFHANVARIVRSRNLTLADSLVQEYDKIAQEQCCKDKYFQQYVYYRNAQISSLPRLHSIRSITKDFFWGKDIAFNNPAYWETFNLVYKDFLPDYINSKAGREISEVLKKTAFNFCDVRDALLKDSLFCDTTFCEVVLLKSIYDGSYEKKYSDEKIDSLLLNAYNTTNSAQIKNIAIDMIKKRTHLKPGSIAPDFTLLDTKGNEVKLSSYRGRFVYLGFFHTGNYQCLKDFPALSGVEKKYKGDVVVVGIMTDEEADKLDDFFSKSKMEWKVLSFTAQQSVVIDYEISSVPAYYLIDPDGRIALANAPGPDESIEVVLSGVLEKYAKGKQNGNDNVRSIYDIVRDVQYK